MKKTIIFGSIAVALIAILLWFGAKNSKSPIQYETEKPFKTKLIGKDLGLLAFNEKGIDFNNLVNLTLIVPIEEVELLLSNTQEGNFRIVQHIAG